MKSSRIFTLISIASLPLIPAFEDSPGDFILIKRDNNISLYERWISRDGSSGQVREIKAVFAVREGIDATIKLLANPQQGTRWNVNAKSYQVLPLTTQQNWITYISYSIPWPFDDQDCCLLYTVIQHTANQSFTEVQFESTTHTKFPVQPGITRLSGTRGKWLLEGRSNGTTQITYLISTDRSAKVPRWISDPIVRNNLFETMTAFKNILEKH